MYHCAFVVLLYFYFFFFYSPIVADKNKKKIKEGKKKLTKEIRRGRRRSPCSESNSDQEFSSREESPLPPAKLTVSLWGKPGVLPLSCEMNNKNISDNESPCKENTVPTYVSKMPSEAIKAKPNVSSASVEGENENLSSIANCTKAASIAVTNNCATENTINDTNVNSPDLVTSVTSSDNSSPKQNTRSTRQSEYARKEKQQLEMPLFFETPNNHKMVS